MDVLKGLNPSQVEAVLETEGPVIVLAGAGSGKTKAIVHRIAYLLDGGISPRRVLAVTFTNKAAGEMRARTISMAGAAAEAVWLCTFHSLCARILRVHIDKLKPIAGRQPYRQGFSIYDDDDRKQLLSDCIKNLGLDHNAESLKMARWWVSYAKLRGFEPEQLEARLANDGQARLARVYELYLARTAASNAVDFDDLLSLTLRLFDENQDVLSIYQDRFEYCMVDEFQDTNRIQYELMKRIVGKHRNLFVVGDDDQSIYAFRGADLRNILDFEKDFPDAKIIHLGQNYRSTKSILSTACSLISKNLARRKKELFTENIAGQKVELCTCGTEVAEAEFVCQEIQMLRKGGGPATCTTAVFYRTNAQSRAVEDVLVRCNMPYKIVRGLRFYERKEVKDVIAYLKASVNPDDDIALLRTINVPPRGIGKVSLDMIADEAHRSGCSLFAAVGRLKDSDAARPALRAKLASFHALIAGLRESASARQRPSEFINYLLGETGYLEFLLESDQGEEKTRAENVKELVSVGKAFEQKHPDASVEDFAHHIALLTDLDEFDERDSPVSLLTLHSAKGLEFDVVFIIGVEKGFLPHYSTRTSEQFEEERRLLYVGMTRAKKRLVLTRAFRRMTFGRTTMNPQSPFIDEIPAELIAKKAFYGDNLL
ncbi:MAG: UvrD-helicase domain-containing protein [Candidatus Coatesbacteria bacterium]|nr:UvrD-helicase domain-containing protein [Candidatus Coatesbacteria bacterium]